MNLLKNISKKMTAIIIGGNFGNPKPSSVMSKLAINLNTELINGGTIEDLNNIDLSGNDLIVWSVNVDNSEEKIYPKKPQGSVLICTKVLRSDRDFGNAVARIFKMNANAVIAIDSNEKPFKFNLIDALGNIWCSTTNLIELSAHIKTFYSWTKGSIRVGSRESSFEYSGCDITDFCNVVKNVADKVENERGGRYFGNASTRCAKMFPTHRIYDDVFLVSGRSTPKDRITPDDFVAVKKIDGDVHYNQTKKPSVDTPIQLELYSKYKNINYMIHGHAYIENAQMTNHYYPCGDMREISSIVEILPNDDYEYFVINLTNHGFLIGANNLDVLNQIVNSSKFKYRVIGEERV